MNESRFIFVTCQIGAEAAVKGELARKWPAFRFAYSRPGFLTFKLPSGEALADDFDLHSVFARAYGFSLGKAKAATIEERAKEVWRIAGDRKFDGLHVWQRDLHEPGYRGYEPGMTEGAREAEGAVRIAKGSEFGVQGSEGGRGKSEGGGTGTGVIGQESGVASPAMVETTGPSDARNGNLTRAGDLVLDCVVVEPDEWWVGYHRASGVASRWPGGLFQMELPAEAVSRAYLKMAEALAWSRMPTKQGEQWAEIGSAPGGASQALLKQGVKVIGIDPAEMDPAVVANPNFTHWKKRGADVRRREFRGVKYLTADINVAPNYTLDTVENIVTHPEVNIRGLLLTLKLLEWKLADELPAYLDRVRSWGYRTVRARQLSHNRQEVCVAARRQE